MSPMDADEVLDEVAGWYGWYHSETTPWSQEESDRAAAAWAVVEAALDRLDTTVLAKVQQDVQLAQRRMTDRTRKLTP